MNKSKPPLYDDLLLGEELDGVHALAVKVAEERVLHPAEGEERHRGGGADVHADVAAGDLVPELLGVPAARGEDGGGVAIGAPVHHPYSLFEVPGGEDAHPGAEYLLLSDGHLWGDALED